MNNNKELKGKLTIGRPQCSSGKEYISIEMTDALSGTWFLSAEMSLPDFAKALTGLGYVDFEFELHPQNVGKIHEHKTEAIVFDVFAGEWKSREIFARRALEASGFETDGWKGEVSDLLNHHKRTSDGKQNVSFHRFVDKQ